jgi:hypothetical protein
MISRRKAFATAILGLIGAATPALAQKPSPVTRFDTDNDSKVDATEAKKAASDLFDNLDADKDGTLSIKELQGRLNRKDLSAADPDKDKPPNRRR